MQTLTIHFVSNFPLELTLNSANIGTLENDDDTISVKVFNEEKIFLKVFPIQTTKNQNIIPFLCEIFILDGFLKTESNNIEITNFHNNIFEVKILPTYFLSQKMPTIFKTLKINNNLIANFVDDGKQNIEIISNKNVFHFVMQKKIHNIQFKFFKENNNDFLYFYGKTTKNQDYLLFFVNFFCKLEIVADVIEITKENIKTLNYQKDIARHGVVQIYNFKNNEFVLSDEYTALLNETPQKTKNEKLIAWAFCEAVAIQDIKLSREYLCDDLNLKLTDRHITTFFGDFCEIVWNKYFAQENTVCFLYGKQEKNAKTFLFEIAQNKITNISTLDWVFLSYCV